MPIDRDHIVQVLRQRGDEDHARDAEQSLPAQVDPAEHAEALERAGAQPPEPAGRRRGRAGGQARPRRHRAVRLTYRPAVSRCWRCRPGRWRRRPRWRSCRRRTAPQQGARRVRPVVGRDGVGGVVHPAGDGVAEPPVAEVDRGAAVGVGELQPPAAEADVGVEAGVARRERPRAAVRRGDGRRQRSRPAPPGPGRHTAGCGDGQRQHDLAALPRHLVLADLCAAGPDAQDLVDLVLERAATVRRRCSELAARASSACEAGASPTAPIVKAAVSAPTARSRLVIRALPPGCPPPGPHRGDHGYRRPAIPKVRGHASVIQWKGLTATGGTGSPRAPARRGRRPSSSATARSTAGHRCAGRTPGRNARAAR